MVCLKRSERCHTAEQLEAARAAYAASEEEAQAMLMEEALRDDA